MNGLSSKQIIKILDKMYPNARCELLYNKDYEFLIAVMLSAQTTDKAVNKVTKILFNEYDSLEKLKDIDLKILENILRPIGNQNKKSLYLKDIVNRIIEVGGGVPNNKEFLLSLSGVGIKTVNVVLGEIFNVPGIAVDTHVYRVSRRLGITDDDDNVGGTEEKLRDFFDEKDWIKLHHQLIFLGRYTCHSRNPNCKECLFNKYCSKKSS